MPQVEQGWEVQYGLFGRVDFRGAAKQAARELGVRLVTLKQLESDLIRACQISSDGFGAHNRVLACDFHFAKRCKKWWRKSPRDNSFMIMWLNGECRR